MNHPVAPGLKVAVAVSLAGAALFAVFGGLGFGYTLQNVTLLGLAGGLFGSVAAPEIEPKAFRHPVLWQVASCVLGFLVCAAILEAGAEGFALAALLGAMAGYWAPSWIKYIQVP